RPPLARPLKHESQCDRSDNVQPNQLDSGEAEKGRNTKDTEKEPNAWLWK
ncbi:MAG: hypothetical protein ACI9NQ_000998, partial [Paracoccaceae bacterium]